ncbi:nuclear transport factor 2 family protein [Actinomadura sp. NPDC047616]|uniref:nuclear transport factor 2 family protein n=1 Tax=Actinomadura sp. NPDC047616 TaxID=3155914 RepID=UPI003408265F
MARAFWRVQGTAWEPDPDPVAQRRLVEAFLAAARGGDLDGLLAVLDPDVVLRADSGGTFPGGVRTLRGARAVAGQAATFRRMATASVTRHALVNGTAGLVNTIDGRLISIMSFTVAGDRIVAIDILSDPDRLARLDLAGLEP